MRIEKRSVQGLVSAISVFICIMAGTLGTPSASQAAFSTLYSFSGYPSDGTSPFGSLTLSGTTLYGMTFYGGAYNGGSGAGTIFKINTNGTGYQVLHNFGSVEADGINPQGSLTLSGSTLYGMTVGGGFYGYGTIFQMNTDGTGYQVLHDFGSGSDGAGPQGSLTLSGSTLYGMTTGGYTQYNEGYGTIFRINTDGTGYQVLYSFGGGSDGACPYGSLTPSGSTLYGMTSGGYAFGYSGLGTIFKINMDGTGYQVLYSFSGGSDGANPGSSLTMYGSMLYGMTYDGGADGLGTIFKINTDGTGYQVLHNFGGVENDGAYPGGSLTLSSSTLYGMTLGTGYFGTIFQINTDGTGYQVLYRFGYSDNMDPSGNGSLTLSGSTLYGMTNNGGTYGDGTIFYFGVTPPGTSGSLTVTITPPGAASAGATWNVDGGTTWYSSGAVVPNLSPGSHTVAFSGVQGWTAPSSQQVTITSGQTTYATGTYTPVYAASFTASRTSGKAPLAVHFAYSSTGSVTKCLWNFGDGKTSKVPHPSHTYSRAGTYTVTLTVTGPWGTYTCTKADYITAYTAPKAHFSAPPKSGDAPLQVYFTNESTGVFTSWLWSFGDGTTSTDLSPAHTYENPGSHKAKLIVYGPGGDGSKTESIRVEK